MSPPNQSTVSHMQESNHGDNAEMLNERELDIGRRLALAELQNARLAAKLREVQAFAEMCETQRARLADEVFRLQELVLLPGLQDAETRHSVLGPASVQSEPAILPFTSQKSAAAALKVLKNTVGRISVIIVRDEVVWEDFPLTGYAIKPDRRCSKKGSWTNVKHGKLLRPANELVARISGVWHYLGTYEPVLSEPFPAQSFHELIEQVQNRVVALAGHKSHRIELRSMLEDGSISMTKISVKRVGVNQRVRDFLASIAELGDGSGQDEGSDGSDDME